MRSSGLSSLVLAGLLAAPASAGPWLREKGKVFTSLTLLIKDSAHADAGAYAEYGLTPKLTLGAKIDLQMSRAAFDATGMPIDQGSLQVFGRRALGSTDKTWRMAYDFGLGIESTDGIHFDPLLRAGFSLGRGIQIGEKYGWLTFDATYEHPLGDTDPVFKLDSTLGLTFSDRWKAMAQLFISSESDSTEITFAPSAVWTPKNHKNSYQIGLEIKQGQTAARLSLWRDF